MLQGPYQVAEGLKTVTAYPCKGILSWVKALPAAESCGKGYESHKA